MTDVITPPIKRVFATDSTARVRAQADPLGGALNPPDRERARPGQIARNGHDPERNMLPIRQHAG